MVRKAPMALTLALAIYAYLPTPAAVPAVTHATVKPKHHVMHILPAPVASKPRLTAEQLWLKSTVATCIVFNESTNGKYSANRWQFEYGTFYSLTGLAGDPGRYSVAVQNNAAFKLYNYDLRTWGNGWQAWSTRFVCGAG